MKWTLLGLSLSRSGSVALDQGSGGLASTVSNAELQEAGADKVVSHLSEVMDLLVSCDRA